MTEQEWLKQFDDTNYMFSWFIIRYFKTMWKRILEEREKNNWGRMMDVMNNVWFALPDNQFNIMENPRGWSEFIHLLEDPPRQENPNDDPSINDNLEQT